MLYTIANSFFYIMYNKVITLVVYTMHKINKILVLSNMQLIKMYQWTT